MADKRDIKLELYEESVRIRAHILQQNYSRQSQIEASSCGYYVPSGSIHRNPVDAEGMASANMTNIDVNQQPKIPSEGNEH